MDYVGFAIVPELTEDAVNNVMSTFYEKERDWFVVGGRYDGYLHGPEVMDQRYRENGDRAQTLEHRLVHNSCRVCDLPPRRGGTGPYFFVWYLDWIKCEKWDPEATHEGFDHTGHFVRDPRFLEKLDAVLAAHQDWYVVVIDAHN